MLKRVKLGARSLTLAVCLTTAVGAVGVMPAYAAPNAPATVHLGDGGDNWLNASEVGAAHVSGTYTGTGITHVRASLAVATSPDCLTSTTSVASAAVPASGGTFDISLNGTSFAEGAYICGRAQLSDDNGATWGALKGSDNIAQKDTVVATPTVAINTNPIMSSNVTAVSITLTGDNGDTALLTLIDSETGSIVGSVALTAASVTVSRNLSSLADGQVTAKVNLTDPAGNTSGPASAVATKDTLAPQGTVYITDPNGVMGPADIAANVPAGWKENTGAASVSAEVWFTDATGNMPASPSNCGRWQVSPTFESSTNPTCMDALPEGIFYFKGQWKDAAGNLGTVAQAQHRKDTTAPAAPTVGAPVIGPGTMAAAPISGVAEAGSSVAVTASQGTTTVTAAPTTAGPNGAYAVTVNVSAFTDGPVNLSAVATDLGGNVGVAGTGTTTKDTVAPAAPTSVAFAAAVVQGNVTAVDITVDGETGTRANVSVDDTSPASLPVTGTGMLVAGKATVRLNLSSLSDGTLTAKVTLTDAGNNTGPARTATGTKDTTGPAAPSITSPSANAASPQRESFTASGSAEPSVIVLLTENGGTEVIGSGSSDSTGAWRIGLKLASGTHAVQARARDDSGNVGPLSSVRIFDVDADLPTVTVETPNYSAFTPIVSSMVDGTASDKPATAIGNVLAIEVTVFDLAGEAVLQQNAICTECPVKNKVEWSFDVAALPPGLYTLDAIAVDVAGNRSAQPARTSFIKI